MEFRNTQLQFNISRDLPAVQVENIQWVFQRTGNSTRRLISPGDDPNHYNFSVDHLTLMIFNLTQADDGNYTVEASNIVGTGSDVVHLDVQSKLSKLLYFYH